jgi:hypothetical protein
MAAVVDKPANVNGLVNGDATTSSKPIKSKNQLRRAKAKQKKASTPVRFSVHF